MKLFKLPLKPDQDGAFFYGKCIHIFYLLFTSNIQDMIDFLLRFQI